jgi:hypothetical protein
VTVEATHGDPLDAELELRIGTVRMRRRDQPVDARIPVHGESGRRYDLIITAIDHQAETVCFDLYAIDPKE